MILDTLEDMQLLISPRKDHVPSGVLSDAKLSSILSIFDMISTGNMSCGKIPLPDAVDTCRDVLDIVLDSLETRETSDMALTQMEQLRFLLSQPHFQVNLYIVIAEVYMYIMVLRLTSAVDHQQ